MLYILHNQRGTTLKTALLLQGDQLMVVNALLVPVPKVFGHAGRLKSGSTFLFTANQGSRPAGVAGRLDPAGGQDRSG